MAETGRRLPDYDEEARKLFALLNLNSSGAASEESAKGWAKYRNLDPVWQHPESGAQVFIGNATASSNAAILQEHGITHIVNCTSDMRNAFEGNPAFKYYRFDIYKYMTQLDLRTHKGVLEFFTPVFEWIDAAAATGKNVLIHCLAGAHRAGTTGVAYCMHGSNLDHRTAITAVKACRSVVDPINDLTDLLRMLEVARTKALAPTKGD